MFLSGTSAKQAEDYDAMHDHAAHFVLASPRPHPF
jgi:hypothetical protein